MKEFTFHISLYDLAFLAAIFIGLTLALLLWFTKKINKTANRLLALALVTVVLQLCGVVGNDASFNNYFLCRLLFQFSLATGPLIFFYVLKITQPEHKFRLNDLFHFTPLLVALIPQVLITSDNVKTVVIVNNVVQLLRCISVTVYLYASTGLVERYYRQLKLIGADRYRYEFRWLTNLLTRFIWLWLLWIPYVAICSFGYHYQLNGPAFYPLLFLLAVIITWIAATVHSRTVAETGIEKPSFLTPSLPVELRQKATWLKRSMLSQQYYKDPGINLNSLAQKLDLSPHELSRIINTVLKKNFYDFINEYRVAEMIKKMQDPANDHLTLAGIATDSGFNSKSTFNRIFKEMTGKSPAEYKNNLKNEIPTYKLGQQVSQYPHFTAVISKYDTTTKWYQQLNRNFMFRNYLIVAFRNLKRNKIFSAINVLGLAIGISASLVIFLMIRFDYSYDRFVPDGGRVYRIVSDFGEQGKEGHSRGTQAPLIDAVNKELTGIELTVPFRYYSPGRQMTQFSGENKPVKFPAQKKIIFADANYFKLLPFHWLAGSQATALQQEGQVVLDESRAKLYFPNKPYEQVIGSSIIYDDTIVARVTGIVQDLDKQGNTDFSFKEFISLATILNSQGLRKQFYWDSWGSTTSDHELFVRLAKGASPKAMDAKLHALADKYLGEDERKNSYTWNYRLQPLNDVHFNKYYGVLDNPVSNKTMLYGLLVIALFLLTLAAINFINLTTAQSTIRAKEIGIRKTMGGSRQQLVLQFLSETFTITLLASLLSLGLLPLLIKAFADYMPHDFHFSFLDPALFIFLAILTLIVSLLSGIYPSLVLSSWNAAAVLKSQVAATSTGTRKARMRQTLTVSQFVIAQFFIMSTLLVGKQIHYMINTDLGFRKDAVLSFWTPDRDTSISRRQTLLNEINKLPAVEISSLASDIANSGGWWTSKIDFIDGKKELHTNSEVKAGDDNYLKLFHIPVIAGRQLLSSDTIREVIINEAYQRELGFQHPQDAIGKTLNWDDKQVPIVGVMKDFHAHTLDNVIKPMVFTHLASNSKAVVVALQTSAKDKWKATIDQMEKAFKRFYPEADFSYNFQDESIRGSYGNELNMEHLMTWGAGLTIFISCLGLLGLVMYTTNQRTKEIGIRKVLGASVSHIVSILSKDFLLLVGIAFVIATPLAWWAIHQWLNSFAYRAPVSWWLFPLSGVVMLFIALITLSFQTIRAASANPVKALRTE
ncbi:MAG: ABC transporter permease [Chitinophagaceae bacterium]